VAAKEIGVPNVLLTDADANDRQCRLSKPELGRSIASCCQAQDISQNIRESIEKATFYSDMQR